MRWKLWVAGLGIVWSALVVVRGGGASAERETSSPRYDADGRLVFPAEFESWTFVGSSLGLTYTDGPPSHEMFHHVYIEPSAYEHYVSEGVFPDGTLLVMTLYGATEKTDFGSGRFSGEMHGVEVAVKDEARYGGWAYLVYGGMGGLANVRPVADPQPRERCYACHVDHADDDNVFVQYYPLLRRELAARSR